MPKKSKKATPEKIKNDELENLLKRVRADFENYRKRTQKDQENYAKYAKTDLILQILPVLDNFRLAVAHLPKELEDNAWVAGIRHIETQLEQILHGEGLKEIETIGKQFDHDLHEAIEEVESERPPGEIVEEVTKGYLLHDKVIRHAKVKVAKSKKL